MPFNSSSIPGSATHLAPLDGLRAAAVFLVMLAHWGYLNGGWIGVQIFFVLSGYLITAGLLRERATAKTFRDYITTFYRKRVCRIFPLYYAYVAISVLVYAAYGEWKSHADVFLSLATFTFNFRPLTDETRAFDHFWSLAVEEQFYLFWPLVVYAVTQPTLKKLLLLVLVLSPALRLIAFVVAISHGMTAEQAGRIVYALTPFQMDAFAAGGAVATFDLKYIRYCKEIFVVVAIGTVLLAAGNAWTLFSSGILKVNTSGALGFGTLGFPYLMLHNGQYVWGYSILNFLAATLIWCIAVNENPCKWLANRFIRYVGQISFGIYVFHLAIAMILRSAFPVPTASLTWLMLFPVYLATSFGLAHLSYQKFESRFLRLKNRIRPEVSS